jgi:hypothetical protein
MVEMAEPEKNPGAKLDPAPRSARPDAGHGTSDPAPPEPGHKTASPEDRMKAMQMAMEFHQGMHNDPQALINTARAILDFVHDKTPA